MMRVAPRDVAITGLGAVCALGDDCCSLWAGIAAGRCGIAPITRFSTADFSVHLGAEVAGTIAGPSRDADCAERLCHEFAVRAAREALADADVRPNEQRVALVFGTGLTDAARPLHELVEATADAIGVRGVRLTVSTACSSSTGAIGFARDLLAMDAADVVLAGGADVLTPEVFAGFHALGVLSPDRCAPFSTPSGTTLGEGAGFVVLERVGRARDRGARVHAYLSGYGLSADAWHETSPDPKGAGIERAIRAALADAAADTTTVDYVNAHGSGTQANDSAEWLGIRRALGGPGPAATALAIPVSSTKGALGHAQGAAGVLEAIVTIIAMKSGVVPPTLNFVVPRPHAPPDPVPGPTPRPRAYGRAVSVNSAFGGANAAIVISRDEGSPAPSARPRRPVVIRGLGLLGAFGQGHEAFLAAAGRVEGRMPPFPIDALVPGADPRGLDPTSSYLTAAAALALRDGGVTMRGGLRERTGLLVGQRRASPASLRAFGDSIAHRGLAQLSAVAFARIVLNAAAGACSKLLSLRGPLSAITTGTGSGLAAIVLAAELLATRDDVALIIAGGVDECPADDAASDDELRGEGAACVLLGAGENGRDSAAPQPAPGIHLAGWGLAPAGHVADAVARAIPGGVPRVTSVLATDDSAGGAAGAVFAFSRAALALRRGSTETALVTSGSGHSLASAVFLSRCQT